MSADDLKARLRKRSADDRKIQANNEAVAAALRGQRLLFEQGVRSDSNTFATRLCMDYERCARNDAALAADWSEAADRIEQLEAALTQSQAEVAAAYERAADTYLKGDWDWYSDADRAIRALATLDQTAALDTIRAEAREQGMREAAVICRNVGFKDHPDSVAYDAEFQVLATITKGDKA